jgi:hypothetical protein
MHLSHLVAHLLELVKHLTMPEKPAYDAKRERMLHGPLPKDSSCYPYHLRLDERQLVREEDLL